MRREIKPRKKKFVLPWFFRIIAWLLCFISIGASIFFLWAYAVQFGNDKTYQWLTTLLVSFFSGILFIEPIKVLLITMFLSCLCRNVDMDDDDVDEDEEAAEVADQTLWYKRGRKGNGSPMMPIDELFLDKLRKERQKEVEIWTIIGELSNYICFIIIVYIISYGNRDPNSFRLQQQIEYNLAIKHGYDEIRTSNDWWDWAHNTFISELRAQAWYNGQPPFGLRGYIGDKTNRIIGYPLLRQVRVIPNSCRVDYRVHSITQECAQVITTSQSIILMVTFSLHFRLLHLSMKTPVTIAMLGKKRHISLKTFLLARRKNSSTQQPGNFSHSHTQQSLMHMEVAVTSTE